ncbi:efflux RND transporter periplasmic adaptor subunit [Pedobacter sp. KACC 23697]|uniref:Efflux RND transporter periplasmic adaptor subunit n=1 Tax=Pedobacter sp. KACC 23697 TaxID=3149230 RepID=A0AAU7K0C4_9SPHI
MSITKKSLSWLYCSLLWLGCSHEPQNASTEQLQALETDFITLNPGSTTVKQIYPGNMEGLVNVDIKAQVSGYLEKIFVKEGDYVQKGQLLFKIKSEVFQEQVSNSSAALQSAVAAQVNAGIEVEKMKSLVNGNVVSPVQLKTAEANLQAASAQVAQAKATFGASKINAGFALIKAPVSGYIGRIPNRIGNLISATDATPLTTLSDISTVYVYFSLSEAEFMRLNSRSTDKATQMNIGLVTADGQHYPENGKLQIASGNIDRVTGTVSMKAVFNNPKRMLRSGGSANVVVEESISDILLVPKAAVKDIQDKFFVYRLADSNKVRLIPIEIKAESGDDYIIRSGLKNGDQIAINRIDVLYDGIQVKPKVKTKS